MLSSRYILEIYALFKMVLDCLRVAIDVFEVVVGGCRWLSVVVGGFRWF